MTNARLISGATIKYPIVIAVHAWLFSRSLTERSVIIHANTPTAFISRYSNLMAIFNHPKLSDLIVYN
jgi:hypothetical protein